MSLPTIESSYVTHTTKSIQGFNHPEYPVLRVALEIMNATEGYLWVCYNITIGHSSLTNSISVIYVDQGWHMVPMSRWTLRLGFSIFLCTV
jgi:hypothetical protein